MLSGIIFAILTFTYVAYLSISGESTESILAVENLAVISLFLALSLVVYTAKDFYIRKKRDWPFSQGRIDKAIEVKGLFGSKRVRLVYSYYISDREYTNDMFDFAQEDAKEFHLKMHPELRNYKNIKSLEGKMVKVFYDPERPWKSAISRRLNQSSLITTLPSLVVICFCLYYLAIIVASLIK